MYCTFENHTFVWLHQMKTREYVGFSEFQLAYLDGYHITTQSDKNNNNSEFLSISDTYQNPRTKRACPVISSGSPTQPGPFLPTQWLRPLHFLYNVHLQWFWNRGSRHHQTHFGLKNEGVLTQSLLRCRYTFHYLGSCDTEVAVNSSDLRGWVNRKITTSEQNRKFPVADDLSCR